MRLGFRLYLWQENTTLVSVRNLHLFGFEI
jgi:hypothetical protein